MLCLLGLHFFLRLINVCVYPLQVCIFPLSLLVSHFLHTERSWAIVKPSIFLLIEDSILKCEYSLHIEFFWLSGRSSFFPERCWPSLFFLASNTSISHLFHVDALLFSHLFLVDALSVHFLCCWPSLSSYYQISLYLLLVSHLSRWRSPCPFFPTTVSYSTFPSSWNLICTWPHVLFVLFFYIEYLFFVVSRYARSFWWLFEQGNQWSFSSTLLAGILRYPWRKLTHIYVCHVWILLAQLGTLDLVCISMRFLYSVRKLCS